MSTSFIDEYGKEVELYAERIFSKKLNEYMDGLDEYNFAVLNNIINYDVYTTLKTEIIRQAKEYGLTEDDFEFKL